MFKAKEKNAMIGESKFLKGKAGFITKKGCPCETAFFWFTGIVICGW